MSQDNQSTGWSICRPVGICLQFGAANSRFDHYQTSLKSLLMANGNSTKTAMFAVGRCLAPSDIYVGAFECVLLFTLLSTMWAQDDQSWARFCA